MPCLSCQCGDTAHEGAAYTQNMNVHEAILRLMNRAAVEAIKPREPARNFWSRCDGVHALTFFPGIHWQEKGAFTEAEYEPWNL